MPKAGYVVIVVFIAFLSFIVGRFSGEPKVTHVEVEKIVKVEVPCPVCPPPPPVVTPAPKPKPKPVVKHPTKPKYVAKKTVVKTPTVAVSSDKLNSVQSP